MYREGAVSHDDVHLSVCLSVCLSQRRRLTRIRQRASLLATMQQSNSKWNSLKNNLLLIIVDASASIGAFVGTVCLFAVRRSVFRKEQDKSMNRDERSYQLSHIYDILFAPKLYRSTYEYI